LAHSSKTRVQVRRRLDDVGWRWQLVAVHKGRWVRRRQGEGVQVHVLFVSHAWAKLNVGLLMTEIARRRCEAAANRWMAVASDLHGDQR